MAKITNVLSLFDGMSCGQIALNRIGIEYDNYFASEIDNYAIKVTQANYPKTIQLGDVTKIKGSDLPKIDILIGGSPCTYWSIAGARKNGEGTREVKASGLGWDLFSQYVRALHEVKPKYFLYENNASMSDDIKKCISEQLGCEPIEIDSADFSAQHRHRYYWTNIPVDMNYVKSKTLFKDIMVENKNIKSFEKYKDTVHVSEDGMCIAWDSSGKGNYSQQNRARKVNQKWNTLPSSGDKNNIYISDCLYRYITPIECERLQTVPDNYTACVSNTQRYKMLGNGWTVDVIAHIFGSLLNGA